MIYKVLVDCEITVFENEDDAGEWRNGKTEVFKAGETVDFDIIGHPLMLGSNILLPIRVKGYQSLHDFQRSRFVLSGDMAY